MSQASEAAGPAARAVDRHPPLAWLVRTVRGFLDDGCLLRASALAYSSLLSFVPLLAVTLALLRGAGFEQSLRPFLLERFPVLGADAIDQLMSYIGRADAAAVGGIGFAALLVSVWTLIGNIESALNHIFGARRARGYARRTGEYLAMVVVGSTVLVASISLQTLLAGPELFARLLGGQVAGGLAALSLALLPWVSTWAGFAFLYAWVPNVRVPLSSAILAGLLGGTLFQLVQLGYIRLQLGFAGYHAVYGALAQLPIVLVWLYVSWSVALLGAEAAAAHAELSRRRAPAAGETLRAPDLLGLALLARVVEAFERGGPAPRAEELALRFGVPVRELRAAAEPLIRDAILAEAEEGGYLPARAAGTVRVAEVIGALERLRPRARGGAGG
jgi:membrane protein